VVSPFDRIALRGVASPTTSKRGYPIGIGIEGIMLPKKRTAEEEEQEARRAAAAAAAAEEAKKKRPPPPARDDWTGRVTQLLHKIMSKSQQRVQDVFRSIDADGSNALDAAEFVQALTKLSIPQKLGVPPERVRRTLLEVFAEMDVDKNGTLSFQEVNKFLRHGRHAVVLDETLQAGAVKVQPKLGAGASSGGGGSNGGGSETAEDRTRRRLQQRRQQEQQQQQQRERQRVRLESISPFASRQKGGKLRPGSAPSGPHGAPPTASASAPSLHPPARPRTAGPTRADGVSISPPASPASKSKLYRSQAVLTWQAKHAYPRISVR
jgi:hypothetical protein